MKIRKIGRILTAVALVLALGLMVMGCNSQDANSGSEATNSPSSTESTSSGSGSSKISVVGSTSVTPLMEELAEAYKAIEPDVSIEIQGVGSAAGIKAATEGTADLGMSSRELKEEEKPGLEETQIALDGIAVILHPNNPVEDLTKDQIAQIFKGEITNWSEVGGSDSPIIVVSREDGSGTRSAFEELMELQQETDGKTISLLAPDAIIANSNGAVKSNIAGKENAIGYMSMGAVDDTVKASKVDGVEGVEAQVQEGNYAISRPFIVMTKGAPSDNVQKFLDFILSDEGQEIVGQDYISVK